MRLYLLTFVLVAILVSPGVVQEAEHHKAHERFQKACNDKNPEAIFYLFSEKMQLAVDLERTGMMVNSFQLQLGPMQGFNLISDS